MADVKVTFKLEGADDVSKQLQDVGKEAQKAAEGVADVGKKTDEKLGEATRNAGENIKKLSEGLKDQAGSVGAVTSKWEELAASARALAGPVGAAAAALGALGVKMGFTGLKEAEGMRILSTQTNIAVESLSKLKYISELTDVPFQALAKSAATLQKNLVFLSQSPEKAMKKPFGQAIQELFNPDDMEKFVREFQRLAPEEQLAKIAEALQKVDDVNRRLGLQQELGFGNALAAFFNEANAEEIAKMSKEIEDFGAVISSKTTKETDQFFDNLSRLDTALSSIRTQLAADIAPGLRKLSDGLVELFKNSSAMKGFTTALSILGQTLVWAARIIAAVIIAVAQAIGDMSRLVGIFVAVMEKMRQAILHPTRAVGELTEALDIVKNGIKEIGEKGAETAKTLKDLLGLSQTPPAIDNAVKGTEQLKKNVEGAAAAAKKMSMSFDDIGSSLQKTGMSDDGGWGLMKTYGSGWQNSAPGGTRKRITDNYIAGQDAAKARAVPDREDWNELLRDVQGFSQQFSQETARMLVNGEKQWSDYFKRIEQMIVEIIINRTIAAPLQKGIEGVLSKAIGALTGQATGGSAPVENTTPAPAPNMVSAAGGGYIPSGYAGLVGENGPEFIAPAQGGRAVIPNDMLSQMGGGAIVVNQVFNGGVTRSDLGVFGAVVRQRTIGAIYDARRRGA